jgi:hypothetical protein
MLPNTVEPNRTIQLLERMAGEMTDGSLHQHHDDIEHEPTPESVAVAVEDQKSAAGTQDSVHLGNDPLLVRIMMEAMRTGDRVERIAGKGEALAVSLNELHPAPGSGTPSLSLLQHSWTQIQATDPRAGKALQNARGKDACATANIQNVFVGGVEHFEEHLVGRLEEQPLEQVAVVASAPAIELLPGVGGAVFHPGVPCSR